MGNRSQIFLCRGIFPEVDPTKMKTAEEIAAFLQPIAASCGAEIYEVVFKQGKNPSLTVFIDSDKEGGVDLDLCEAVHNAIDGPLDELDPTFGRPYTLNVSSPGLDRPFRNDKDFYKNIGKKVEIRLYAPIKGQKFFEAVLEEFDPVAGNIRVSCEKDSFKLNLNQIAKISQAIDFE